MGNLALLLAMFACAPHGYGISITKAQIHPSGLVSQSDEVELTVELWTGASPAFLYRATEFSTRRDEIIVRIYPDEGLLDVPDSLTERLKIGQFSPGDYRLLVLLEPASSFYGSPTFTVLQFTVVPILHASINIEGTFVLRWEDPRREFILEWTNNLAAGEWTKFPETPTFTGRWHWLWLPDALEERSFFRLARNR